MIRLGTNSLSMLLGTTAVNKIYHGTDIVHTTDSGQFPANSNLFLRLSPNGSTTTTETVTQTFAPSDVILATNRITLPDLKITAPTTVSSFKATRFKYSTTGTPAAPLIVGNYYYLAPHLSGGYKVYEEVTSSNWSTYQPQLSAALPEETPMPAQNLFQDNYVVFSSQGTGTHSFVTEELLLTMPNLVSGATPVTIYHDVNDRSRRFELKTVSGRKAINQRILVRDPADKGSYNLYGFKEEIGPSVERVNFQLNMRNKRCIYQAAVINNKDTDTQGLAKCPVVTSGVNTTTGVFTKGPGATAHTFTTGWMIKVFPWIGGTLPSGLSTSNTYYVRSVNATTFTLHDSLSNATTNTAPIIPTTQGTIGFTAYAPQVPSDSERMRFIAEVREQVSGGNVCTVRQNGVSIGDVTQTISTDFTVSGTNNGRVGFTGRNPNALVPTSSDKHYVYVWIPTASTGPTCIDTGLPLTSGYYWLTRELSSSAYSRLHRTEADANASLGLSTQLATCIKYSAAGDGYLRIESAQGRPVSAAMERGTELAVPGFFKFPRNQRGLVEVIIDYNNPSATGILQTWYWNGVQVGVLDITATKGNTNSTTSVNDTGMTLLNSAAGHVTFEGELYDFMLGSSTGALTMSDFASQRTWLMNYYNITA